MSELIERLRAGDPRSLEEAADEIQRLTKRVEELENEAGIVAQVPDDPGKCFAFLISRCASAYGTELIERTGITDTQARNVVIGAFLAMASGEACRVARSEGREPDPQKWRAATDKAFADAVEHTAALTAREQSQ